VRRLSCKISRAPSADREPIPFKMPIPPVSCAGSDAGTELKVPILAERPIGYRASVRETLVDGRGIVRPAWDIESMEQRISLVTLGVDDLSRARRFYEALGWSGARQPDGEVCFFQAGGMVFGLWTALGGHGAPGVELAHNVRSPEEVDAVLAEAERAGGTVVRPSGRADWGGTTGAFADPDGYVWEVAHNPAWTLDDDGSIHI